MFDVSRYPTLHSGFGERRPDLRESAVRNQHATKRSALVHLVIAPVLILFITDV